MSVYWPDYCKDFRCKAGECLHTCCAGWVIGIDDESLERFGKDPEVSEKIEDGCFVLKENGKTKEYCGVKVFSGKWTMNTTDTIVLSDHNTGEAVCVDILCDPFGNINGFDIGGTVYTLAA